MGASSSSSFLGLAQELAPMGRSCGERPCGLFLSTLPLDVPDRKRDNRNHTSTWIPHSRFKPKKRVSSSRMPGSQREVVWKSPIET